LIKLNFEIDLRLKLRASPSENSLKRYGKASENECLELISRLKSQFLSKFGRPNGAFRALFPKKI